MTILQTIFFVVVSALTGGLISYTVLTVIEHNAEIPYLRKRLSAIEQQVYEHRRDCVNATHDVRMDIIDLKFKRATPTTINLIGADVNDQDILDIDVHLGDDEPVEVLTPVATAD